MADDGAVYENADFILNYASFDKEPFHTEPLLMVEPPDEIWLLLDRDFEIHNQWYYFVASVLQRIKEGLPVNRALQEVYETTRQESAL